jgi:6-phosphogluconolactonase (cycloisomerase 2 family)
MRNVREVWFSPLLLLLVLANAYSQVVYTNNNTPGANTVSALRVGASGELIHIQGSPFLTGGQAGSGGFFGTQSAEVCLLGSLLFVGNNISNDISGFIVNEEFGTAALVPGSPFATGGNGDLGIQLACTPDGKFLFAANSSSSDISVFRIAANGALMLVGVFPLPAGGLNPLGIKVTPNNKFLMLAQGNSTTNGIAVLRIASDGTLSPVPGSPFRPKGGGVGTAIETNYTGSLVFVSEQGLNQTLIDVYTMSSDGRLTPVSGSPFKGTSGDVFNLLLSANQQILFASNSFENMISVFRVGLSGALTQIHGSPFQVVGGLLPGMMSTDNLSEFLHVANLTNTVNGFRVAPDGGLTPAPNTPFPTGATSILTSIITFPPKDSATFFDVCLEDDTNGNILQISSLTNCYQFTNCRKGTTLTGKGTFIGQGCKVGFQAIERDRRISASIDFCNWLATANVQLTTPSVSFTINDRNIFNNSCVCK